MAREPQSLLNSLVTVVVVVSLLFRQLISLWMINCVYVEEALVGDLQMDELCSKASGFHSPQSTFSSPTHPRNNIITVVGIVSL